MPTCMSLTATPRSWPNGKTSSIRKYGVKYLITPFSEAPTRCLSAHASASLSQQNIQSTKGEIERLSGKKHGTDRSAEEKAHIAELAMSLAQANETENLDLLGSKWRLVFTESMATSAGKVGPFVGRVVQEFPASTPGQYVNWLYFGPFSISLGARYEGNKRGGLDVSFTYLQVEGGPWKWKKELKNRGTWDPVYIDPTYRVIRTNGKNLFVLEKL